MATGNLAFRYEEVYLHTVLLVFARWVGVEKQFATIGHQHLCHDILHQHACIDLQLETQPDTRFCCVEGKIYHLGITQPIERTVVVAEAGILIQICQMEFVLVELKPICLYASLSTEATGRIFSFSSRNQSLIILNNYTKSRMLIPIILHEIKGKDKNK